MKLASTSACLALTLFSWSAIAHPVTIDPSGFEGRYIIVGVTPWADGPLSVDLPEGTYRVGFNSIGTPIDFTVDENGGLTIAAASTEAATASGSTISFITHTINIDPSSFLGRFYIFETSQWLRGPSTVEVVTGQNRLFFNSIGEEIYFLVDENGSITIDERSIGAAVANQSTLTLITYDVLIDPGAYEGSYVVFEGPALFNGTASISLPVGRHWIWLDRVIGGAIDFHVARGGSVIIDESSLEAATSSGPQLIFRNAEVFIDAGTFPGWYGIFDSMLGSEFFVTVPDPRLRYQLWIDGGDMIEFSVSMTGEEVSVTSHVPTSAVGNGDSLSFVLRTVTVNTGRYEGVWGFWRVSGNYYGNASIELIADMEYRIQLTYEVTVPFFVEYDGTTSTTHTDSLETNQSTVSLRTIDITYDANGFTPCFTPIWPSIRVCGTETVAVVPGLSYKFFLNYVQSPFSYHVSADGTLSGETNGLATFLGSTMRLEPVFIHIETEALSWAFYYNNYLSGSQTVGLLPELEYSIATNGTFPGNSFTVSRDCRAEPSQLVDLDGTTFTMTCASNETPVADAGDATVVCAGELVTLDGSRSVDPEGLPLDFQWRQVAGTTVDFDEAAEITEFVAPTQLDDGETLTIELTVTDAWGDTATDSVDIAVRLLNGSPVADAGDDLHVAEGAVVVLSGTGSYDPDGDTLRFEWVQVDGPAVEVFDADTSSLSFIAPPLEVGGGEASETLSFELIVTDVPSNQACGGASSAVDTVTVNVENVNHEPTAVSGEALTVSEGQQVLLDGSASSDPDSDVLQYTWIQLEGTPMELSNDGTAIANFVAPEQESHGQETLIFELAVDDGFGGFDVSTLTVTVLDVNAPPDCTLARPNIETLWPPNHRFREVSVEGVLDPDDTVVITINTVFQDEPTEGLGDGDTAIDAIVEEGRSLSLRAERSGVGDGRIYHVQFEASDGFGGSCTGTVAVCVPRSQRGGCVDGGPAHLSTVD